MKEKKLREWLSKEGFAEDSTKVTLKISDLLRCIDENNEKKGVDTNKFFDRLRDKMNIPNSPVLVNPFGDPNNHGIKSVTPAPKGKISAKTNLFGDYIDVGDILAIIVNDYDNVQNVKLQLASGCSIQVGPFKPTGHTPPFVGVSIWSILVSINTWIPPFDPDFRIDPFNEWKIIRA